MQKLMAALGARLDKSTRSGTHILEWDGGAPDAREDAVPLRLAGALHSLVREGRLPELYEIYHNFNDCSDEDLANVALDAIGEFDDYVHEFLNFAPQTNEVRRAAAVYAGLLQLRAMYDLPVSLFELGCSAGLNLQLGSFGYNFDGKQYGDGDSAVLLSPRWSGNLPKDSEIEVVSRMGCDLNPLDVSNPDDCGRLLAYVWPDQADRISRTEKAIAIAQANPPTLFAVDAASWVRQVLDEEWGAGTLRVIYHTIAWQYFPEDTKNAIQSDLGQYGAQATEDSPLAWLGYEMSNKGVPELTLKRWPGGEEQLLARGNAHVEYFEWLA